MIPLIDSRQGLVRGKGDWGGCVISPSKRRALTDI